MKASTPCRLVWWVSLLTEQPLELIDVDLLVKKEHLTPEFMKLNPRHCVPTYVEEKNNNKFVMTESRAIANRLLNKTGDFRANSSEEKSRIEEMVQYDLGTFYKRIGEYVYPQIFKGSPPNNEKLQNIHKSLKYIDNILSETGYIARGLKPTLADFTIAMSTTMLSFTDIQINKYKHISKWINNLISLNPTAWITVNKPFEDWVKSVK